MSEFLNDPKIVLVGKEDLLNALDNHDWDSDNNFKWEIKSLFIIDCIDEIVNDGKYPYNARVNELVSKKLGLPEHDYNESGSPLSTLVYDAQRYRRSDNLKNDGYQPLTQNLIELAFEQHKKIQLLGYNVLLSQTENVYVPKKLGDKIYLMKPRVRKWYIRVEGQPAKIV